MKLSEIARQFGCELDGDGRIEVSGVATLELAGERDISFLTNAKYFNEAKATNASAIIAGLDCPPVGPALLRHKNPYLIFAKIVELFFPPSQEAAGIHPTAWIADSARVGTGVAIGAHSYVGDNVVVEDRVIIRSGCSLYAGSRIGEGSLIHAGCVVRENVIIGRRCIVHSNSVIGSDGFGFAREEDGSWYKILQTGTVILEDDVEIGACTTIDRAALGETRIGKGTKVDNLVQIGHGSIIGGNNLICAQVGLAGSTRTGKNVVLAGQVGVVGHLTIGDGATVTAQAGIPGSVEPGKVMSGSPAIDNKDWLRSTVAFAKLPKILKAVRDLERRISQLEAR
ncbi:MAG: UDP-3-O-(3-hydroxymyristoyl)glucosamine N-acyltransferase [Acidobacteriota bacterium]